jgi:hypothetical protein
MTEESVSRIVSISWCDKVGGPAGIFVDVAAVWSGHVSLTMAAGGLDAHLMVPRDKLFEWVRAVLETEKT